MTRTHRTTVILLVLLACVGLDQFTKALAIQNLKGHPVQTFFGDFFRFEYSENPGAFLSLGAGMTDDSRFWILTVSVALCLVGLTAYLVIGKKISRSQLLQLSLILGGGVSNLLDRMFRPQGRVVDFMNMGIGGLRTGIFNVADMAIMAGIGLMLIYNRTEEDEKQDPAQA